MTASTKVQDQNTHTPPLRILRSACSRQLTNRSLQCRWRPSAFNHHFSHQQRHISPCDLALPMKWSLLTFPVPLPSRPTVPSQLSSIVTSMTRLPHTFGSVPYGIFDSWSTLGCVLIEAWSSSLLVPCSPIERLYAAVAAAAAATSSNTNCNLPPKSDA